MTFNELGLLKPIIMGLESAGHVIPTPIQEQTIPHILKGKDVLGCAQTGTGKTAAFVLPILQHLIKIERPNKSVRPTKVLILTPTRELAIQIRDNIRKYSTHTNIKCGVILGGVNQRSQNEILKKGVDIIVATPGRLLDLINQKRVKLNELDMLVLDEADTMLDMGFIHDVKKIVSYVPSKRQTLFFSATMPKKVSDLANSFLTDYVTVKVNNESITIDEIQQVVYFVNKNDKVKLLKDILNNKDIKSLLIFTRTKHGADKLSISLHNSGIASNTIHGDKSQNARIKALTDFKKGICKILIATDVAARGIDIKGLSHVINYDIPVQAETYIHRIGRTGRAGLSGIAISFCDGLEKKYLKDIEKLIEKEIEVVTEHNYMSSFTEIKPMNAKSKFNGRKREGQNNFRNKNKNNFNSHNKKRNWDRKKTA